MGLSQAVRQLGVLGPLCPLNGIGSFAEGGGGIMCDNYRRHPMHTQCLMLLSVVWVVDLPTLAMTTVSFWCL